MIYQIKNNDLEITLSDSGAEMIKVCSKEGCNYLSHGMLSIGIAMRLCCFR